MKVVLNKGYGNFCISEEFFIYYDIPYAKINDVIIIKEEKYLQDDDSIFGHECMRYDQRLIDYIEEFGSDKASGRYSNLQVEEVKPGTKFVVTEYDGYEEIKTENDFDWVVAT